jgi:hypothetical protein
MCMHSIVRWNGSIIVLLEPSEYMHPRTAGLDRTFSSTSYLTHHHCRNHSSHPNPPRLRGSIISVCTVQGWIRRIQEKLDGRWEALDPAAAVGLLGGAGGQVGQLDPRHRHLLRRQRRLRHNVYVVS